MKVRFFRQRPNGSEEVGALVLRQGKLMPEPPDSIALNGILDEPPQVFQEDGPPKLIDHKAEPEVFLRALASVYHGTYFWASTVED